MLSETKSLSVYYDKLEAVKGVNLTVDEGELVGIIGSNGAGKTSTLNAISGIVRHQGEIWFKGERIDKLPPEQIAKRGVIQVPEGRKLFAALSVMDNLKMGAYLLKDKVQVSETLEKVFYFFSLLKNRSNQRADSLSGGEQQMLSMGRAFMANPSLILMDEPSLGLSPIACQAVRDQCVSINQEGVAILLVEQNARMALNITKRVYALEKGNVVMEGSSKTLAEDTEIKKVYFGV